MAKKCGVSGRYDMHAVCDIIFTSIYCYVYFNIYIHLFILIYIYIHISIYIIINIYNYKYIYIHRCIVCTHPYYNTTLFVHISFSPLLSLNLYHSYIHIYTVDKVDG